MITIIGVTYGPPSPDRSPTFSQAVWTSGSTSEILPLPARPKPTEDSATSSFHFEWENTGELSEPVLFAPTLFHLHELRINDQLQTDSLRYSYLAGNTYTSRPLLVRLPVDGSSIRIDITLEGSDVLRGYVSKLWIGERMELKPYYNQQHMTTIGFRKFMSYWLLLLAIVMALLWALGRQEVSYGLFAVIAAWQVINNLPIIIDNSLLTMEWFLIAYLSGFWKAVILVPFAYNFTKTHSPLPIGFFYTVSNGKSKQHSSAERTVLVDRKEPAHPYRVFAFDLGYRTHHTRSLARPVPIFPGANHLIDGHCICSSRYPNHF